MARILISRAQEPLRLLLGGDERWICMCGLSQNPPFCEGLHLQTEGEDPESLYLYRDGKRMKICLTPCGEENL
ncbi:MAG TPA: CDGSH iron-sulfur domain-containing protein [Thermoanaerobaculia bacterium]|nr:CDGSH iron-sulfur domain-containing protein [Thermoanaerobaculia bacterium]HUM30724.1 CDGSH iron-sulfur domain-containing protein [Thermoanaerobaculia bacterium]HXK68987.1 CDGSH iron-sulfur domain-containing protein [Thermoanaerobaculia bacterium]